ncbi:ESCRT II complex subunit Dot2 [Saitoella coloradoensis]
MQRRGVGLAAFDRDQQQRSQYQELGSALLKTHIDELTSQLATFQSTLSSFATLHAREIRSDPEFREKFSRMCAAIGVDPLSSGRGGKGGIKGWSEMLGVGDFYYELAVRIVEVCRRTRQENGGLIEVGQVRELVSARLQRAGGNAVTEDAIEDVIRAVKTLQPLGKGIEIVTIGSTQMIRSVPRELSNDQATVLEAAQLLGFVSKSMLVVNLQWDHARASTVLDDLMSNSLVWVDDQGEELEYYSSALINGG